MDWLEETPSAILKKKPDIFIDLGKNSTSWTAVQFIDVKEEKRKMAVKGKLLSISAIAKGWGVRRTVVIHYWRDTRKLPVKRFTASGHPRFLPLDVEAIFGAPSKMRKQMGWPKRAILNEKLLSVGAIVKQWRGLSRKDVLVAWRVKKIKETSITPAGHPRFLHSQVKAVFGDSRIERAMKEPAKRDTWDTRDTRDTRDTMDTRDVSTKDLGINTVVCVDNCGMENNFELGIDYILLGVTGKYYVVENMLGERVNVYKERFSRHQDKF